ncbi:hypothetical protein TWF281_001461 [Arthrobotrys megalospora]
MFSILNTTLRQTTLRNPTQTLRNVRKNHTQTQRAFRPGIGFELLTVLVGGLAGYGLLRIVSSMADKHADDSLVRKDTKKFLEENRFLKTDIAEIKNELGRINKRQDIITAYIQSMASERER